MQKEGFIILIFIFFLIISIFFVLTDFLKFKLGLDLAGGVVLTYDADLKDIKKEEKEDVLLSIKDLIERRINFLGIGETSVTYSRSGRIIVEIPQIKEPASAINLIGETPVLEFRTPVEDGETKFVPSKLTGKYLKTAIVQIDPNTGFPSVGLEFDSEGGKIFEELTKKYIGKSIAIYLDGTPISIPTVREVITGGKAVIEGNFTFEEARELARRLKQGALPVPLKLIGNTTINPILGEKFLELSIKGGIIGIILILTFMLFFYKTQGFIANIALIFYIFFNLFIYKLFGVVLSLAGITGLILSIGMAVDANILISERIKEERRKNLRIYDAIKIGFERAWPSIRDSNITTIISCIFIYFLTTSFVRGFALTLGLGVLISMLTAVFLTRILTNKIVPALTK